MLDSKCLAIIKCDKNLIYIDAMLMHFTSAVRGMTNIAVLHVLPQICEMFHCLVGVFFFCIRQDNY